MKNEFDQKTSITIFNHNFLLLLFLSLCVFPVCMAPPRGQRVHSRSNCFLLLFFFLLLKYILIWLCYECIFWLFFQAMFKVECQTWLANYDVNEPLQRVSMGLSIGYIYTTQNPIINIIVIRRKKINWDQGLKLSQFLPSTPFEHVNCGERFFF